MKTRLSLLPAATLPLPAATAAGEGAHVTTFDVGAIRKLDANSQLDCGVKLGRTRNAHDALALAGISRRF